MSKMSGLGGRLYRGETAIDLAGARATPPPRQRKASDEPISRYSTFGCARAGSNGGSRSASAGLKLCKRHR